METKNTINKVSNVMDMTSGNAIKQIIVFAIPLLIGNVFQQIYSIVDTMIAGYNLGDNAIAAIGATTSLYSLILNFAIGMNAGFAIIVTKNFGAHNKKEFAYSVSSMIILNVIIGCVMTILSLVFISPILHLLNTPEAIFNQSRAYISYICGGMLATIAYNMFSGILRAVGNSKTSLYFLIISTVLNIGLDSLFIIVFGMGVKGAAIATVIAQGISALLSGIYVFKQYKDLMPGKSQWKLNKDIVKEMLSMGSSMALMYCVVDLGSVIFQSGNNTLGEHYLASYTSARRLIVIFMQPLTTFSSAFSTFTSQNWGAGQKLRIRKNLIKVLFIEMGMGVLFFIIMLLFGPVMVRFTTGTSDSFIIDNAYLSMKIHGSCFIALGVLFCLRMSMQSLGQKIIPVISSIIELLMKIFSASFLIPKLGYLGTCITEPVTWLIMTAFLLSGYFIVCRKMIKN